MRMFLYIFRRWLNKQIKKMEKRAAFIKEQEAFLDRAIKSLGGYSEKSKPKNSRKKT